MRPIVILDDPLQNLQNLDALRDLEKLIPVLPGRNSHQGIVDSLLHDIIEKNLTEVILTGRASMPESDYDVPDPTENFTGPRNRHERRKQESEYRKIPPRKDREKEFKPKKKA